MKNKMLVGINSEYTNRFPALETLLDNVAYYTEACHEFIDKNGELDDMPKSQKEEYLSMLQKNIHLAMFMCQLNLLWLGIVLLKEHKKSMESK